MKTKKILLEALERSVFHTLCYVTLFLTTKKIEFSKYSILEIVKKGTKIKETYSISIFIFIGTLFLNLFEFNKETKNIEFNNTNNSVIEKIFAFPSWKYKYTQETGNLLFFRRLYILFPFIFTTLYFWVGMIRYFSPDIKTKGKRIFNPVKKATIFAHILGGSLNGAFGFLGYRFNSKLLRHLQVLSSTFLHVPSGFIQLSSLSGYKEITIPLYCMAIMILVNLNIHLLNKNTRSNGLRQLYMLTTYFWVRWVGIFLKWLDVDLDSPWAYSYGITVSGMISTAAIYGHNGPVLSVMAMVVYKTIIEVIKIFKKSKTNINKDSEWLSSPSDMYNELEAANFNAEKIFEKFKNENNKFPLKIIEDQFYYVGFNDVEIEMYMYQYFDSKNLSKEKFVNEGYKYLGLSRPVALRPKKKNPLISSLSNLFKRK